MADKKISQLSAASLPLAGTEVLPIVQSSATVKVATDDLTIKNIRSNASTGILQITGPAAASTQIMTVPNANFTAARTDAAQSFTGDQTLSTGNLIIGTAGKGIDFSANAHAAGMTSELLNDYEEGTWTPVIIGSTNAGTATYSAQVGSYTKCGRSVFVTCSVSWTGHTGTGDLRITGLPFATASAYQSTVNLGYITDIAFNANATPLIRTSTSSTVLFLAQLASGGASISAIPISSAGNILLSSTYIV